MRKNTNKRLKDFGKRVFKQYHSIKFVREDEKFRVYTMSGYTFEMMKYETM